MSFQAMANVPNQARPTGELGVVNGLGNPIPYPTGPGLACSGNTLGGPYQQINVGDIMCQYYDATYGMIAIPAAAVPAGATAASGSAASKLALQQVHGAALEPGTAGSSAVCYGFLGLSLSYRDPNDKSYGKSKDRISIAPKGRAKMRVISTDANFALALPAGTLVGCAVNNMSTGASSFLGTPLPGYVQTSQACGGLTALGGNTYTGTTVAGTTTPLIASEAIGRLAFDKAANDTFVWVDFISTIIEGGVQNTLTNT